MSPTVSSETTAGTVQTPVVSSDTPSTNIATGAAAILNATDPDSEVTTPDGQTLIVDSQQDSDLVFISNLLGTPTATYLPHAQRNTATSRRHAFLKLDIR